MRSKLWIC